MYNCGINLLYRVLILNLIIEEEDCTQRFKVSSHEVGFTISSISLILIKFKFAK